jgi:hypothetical protein
MVYCLCFIINVVLFKARKRLVAMVNECAYCGEESKYVPLIPKPNYFISNNILSQMVHVSSGVDLICLECLEFEINELKDVY